MFHATGKWFSIGLLLFISASACSRPAPFNTAARKPTDKADAPFDPPNTYPEWAFDSPQYVKPAQELTPEPKAKPGDPLHYFTKEKVVLIRQPAGYTPEEIPRIAVWWTDNNGFRWQKAGFFGREQTYFAFEAQEDGDYGIRFVGPNQEQAMQATAFPERVYHVDTTLPEVEVTIEPEQTWYNVGQSVTVAWRAEDYHLIEFPVTVTAMLDFTADESKPIEIQKGLAKDGSITFQIPSEALNHELRFRVDALDRANNLGIAYSYALQVVAEPVDQFNTPDKKAPQEEQVSIKSSKASNVGHVSVGHSSPVHASRPEKVAANPPARKTSTEESTDASTAVVADAYGQPDAPATARQPLDAPPPVPEIKIAANPAPGSTDSDEKIITPLTLRAGTNDDITQGNGLLVPLPATVDCNGGGDQMAFSHPWRCLASALKTPLKSIWELPSADFVQKNPALKNLFLAGAKAFRPVGEPVEQQSHVAMQTSE